MLNIDIKRRQGDFTLDVAAEFPGGITSIFGPSGSGKTTTLRCIAGLARPDTGAITLDNRTLYSSDSGVNLAAERRRTGIVFQDGALFPHLSVQSNIEYGYRLTPAVRRRIDPEQVIDLLGLRTMLTRRVTTLSGGEQQRVALARALAMSPDLLLLDEPTASLDHGLRGAVLSYLRDVHKRLEVPMIYVSHDVSEVMFLAERVLRLKDGKADGFGPPSRVLLSDASVGADGETGLENILEGRLVSAGGPEQPAIVDVGGAHIATPAVTLPPGTPVTLTLRASDVIVAAGRPQSISARNVISAACTDLNRTPSSVFATFDIGAPIIVELTPSATAELNIQPNATAHLLFKSTAISIHPIGNFARQ